MDSLIFGQNKSSPPNCPSCTLNNYGIVYYYFIFKCLERFNSYLAIGTIGTIFCFYFLFIENYQWHDFENNCSKSSYEVQHRRLKTDIPREKKDAKYYEKRKRNNMAAKKSREAKRRRDNEVNIIFFRFQKLLFCKCFVNLYPYNIFVRFFERD